MKRFYVDYENVIQGLSLVLIIAAGVLAALHTRENPQNAFATTIVFLGVVAAIGIPVYKATLTDKNFGRINYALNKRFGALIQEEETMDAIVWERSVSEKKCWVSVRLYDKFSGLYTWPYSAEVDPQLWKSISEHDHIDAECLVTRHLYGGRHHVEGAKVISLSLKK